MADKIFYSDFNFIEDIGTNDFAIVQKMRGRMRDLVWIVCSGILITLASILLYFHLIYIWISILVIASSIFIIIIRSKHLFCDSSIIGLAYGNVTEKQTKNKIMTGHDDRDILPWHEGKDHNGAEDKPLLSSVKQFYYVEAFLYNRNTYIDHICCYKKDFDKLKKGDKIIIIRFKNNIIVAAPSSNNINEN